MEWMGSVCGVPWAGSWHGAWHGGRAWEHAMLKNSPSTTLISVLR